MSFSSPQREGGDRSFFTPELSLARPHLSEPSLTATKKRLLDVLPKIDDAGGNAQIPKKNRGNAVLNKDEVVNRVVSDGGEVGNDKVTKEQIVVDKVENSICLEIINTNGIRQGYNCLNRDWMVSELLEHLVPGDKHHSIELYDQKNQVVPRDKLVSNLDQDITYRIKAAKTVESI